MVRTRNLFISHSWGYGNAYQVLTKLLSNRNYFEYKDYSVPKNNPIKGARTDKQLEAAIEVKMRPCSAVLIMAGKYSTYSKWINKEIAMAKRLSKPIIAVKPWGASQISTVVRQAANVEAAWNSDSIVNAIRQVS